MKFLLDKTAGMLEAIAIADQASPFVGQLGQKIASDKVTLCDDGSIPGLYGSTAMDDEGHPTQKNVLIEKGVLKGYLCDRFNGRRIGMMTQRILEVNNLAYSFDTYAGEVQAVRGVSFHVDAGETLAIVGESGCGKTVSVQAILKLLPEPPGRLVGGSIRYLGEEISQHNPKKMSRLRGKEMSIIFQDPMTSLNPTMRIGKQIVEGIRKHERISRREGRARAIQMLGKVGIPSPERNMNRFPHQFSGGMRQRVMIAMPIRTTYHKRSIFPWVNACAMILLMFVTLYPVLNTVAISFNDGTDAVRGGIGLWPRVFSTKSYETIFQDEIIYNAFFITISRTVIQTVLNVIITSMIRFRVSNRESLITLPGSINTISRQPATTAFTNSVIKRWKADRSRA